ncbi:hypothetical protein Pfo_029089 [Paulownia fortunei]|nr:hypothetical protein Pfo_029089 [Paulownia fortunei]
MSSGKPLLSQSEPFSAPKPQPHHHHHHHHHHRHSSLRISSLDVCAPLHQSLRGTSWRKISLQLKVKLTGNLLERPALQPARKEFWSAELHKQCPPRERKRLVSWGGVMDLRHNMKALEISGASSRALLLLGVAYLYFLAIAALNQLPPLAVFGRTVSLFPLLFVLTVTAVKDGYEDWRRHRSDRNENNREALVLQSDEFRPRRWKKIQAGEVVKISSDEAIPCDMVLLGTNDPSGIAYIQTMNLDGESNLKTRYARQETNKLVLEGTTISGVIRCEQPNRNIYEFMANMEVKGQRFPLSQSNIILRGCQLKNTEWQLGLWFMLDRIQKLC